MVTKDESKAVGRLAIRGSFVIIALIIGGMFAIPYWDIYRHRLNGEAELAHAEFSKRVAVETAKAKRDAATLEAEAEVERANGVAKANKIIGESLHNNEAYLRYLWIIGLEHNQNQTVVYIPTEANLPILEATRIHK